MTGLRIAKDFELPIDSVTSTFGILATKGAGKSNAAVAMAEEMFDAGIPWVAVDPKGDWWGIRSSANGKGPGLPIVVFGGRHGDVPLEPTAGELLADLVLEQRLTCVLDVSEFTKGEATRFLLAFARRLFRNAESTPLHLFLEEAHEYLPQQVRGDQAEMVGAWQRIVKQGRFKGLGCTLISQRAAVVNKDVLELVDTLIVMRTIGPRSRDAVAGWVKDQDVDTKLLASLPTLADGEAWIWSPGALRIMQRIRFRRRRTFDSGATPKVGEKRQPPATLADVDLAVIKEQMAETIERAVADNPKILRARIAKLEQELAIARAVQPETVVERVEVPVIDSDTLLELEQMLQAPAGLLGEVQELLLKHRMAVERGLYPPHQTTPDLSTSRRAQTREPTRTNVAKPQATPARAESNNRSRNSTTDVALVQGAGALGKRERAILTVLAQYPQGRTQRQIALLTGYSPKASTIGAGLSTLRKHGNITPSGLPIITAAGVAALGDEFEPLPRGEELLTYWLGQLGKRERDILTVLLDIYPDAATLPMLADRTGYSAAASTIGAGLSRLRGLELADGWRASDDFVRAIGRA